VRQSGGRLAQEGKGSERCQATDFKSQARLRDVGRVPTTLRRDRYGNATTARALISII
jgi:hypothetical protein